MQSTERLQITILGVVQGVGFRPFVYRLAQELKLTGWVRNDGMGVSIEVEGSHSILLEFLDRVQKEKPSPSILYALDHRFLLPSGFEEFRILSSESSGPPQVWILPDISTCEQCRNEVLEEGNRRVRYPFTNCTHCGTRFTIIHELPYDRPRTSMMNFSLCAECRREYEDPMDRRFHAQPNACGICGPRLEFRSLTLSTPVYGEEALRQAESSIRSGQIVAVKGIGGYHLMLDARNEHAAVELRQRKKRRTKPFAVLYPNVETVRRHVRLPATAESFLRSPQAPILVLPRTETGFREIAVSVAPQSPYLGVFLPYSPLHILLLHDLDFPVVATSGNISEEPIEFEDSTAAERLSPLCDGILTHNRPIVRPADDSVMHFIATPEIRPQLLRRARGYTPLPVLAPRPLPPILALGGHMNVTFALSRNREIILSQHLGDMENFESRETYQKMLKDFLRLYQIQPIAVAHDLHPDYFTTRYAEEWNLPRIAVQHHHAHLAACMLENEIEEQALGLTWDGTGYGTDQTIWGGEFLLGTPAEYRRIATLQPFRLPGGERAIQQTWRIALSLLQEAFGSPLPRNLPLFDQVPARSVELTLQMLERNVQCSPTTSMGRLFDGVSAILGLSLSNTHQAESAQLLEYAAWRCDSPSIELPLPVESGSPVRLDWRPLIRKLVELQGQGAPAEELAAAFHIALTETAMQVIAKSRVPRVVLAGGVFCNRYLTENFLTRCRERDVKCFVHSQLPPTDGSLAAGQLWVAAQKLQ